MELTRKQAFIEKHDSGEGTITTSGGWIMYPSGAVMEAASYGVLREPPDDLYEAAKLRLVFWEAKTSSAIKEFNDVRQNIVRTINADIRAGYSPIPSQQAAMPELEKLRDKVRKFKDKRKVAIDDVEANKPEGITTSEEQDAANQAEAQKALDEVNEISI